MNNRMTTVMLVSHVKVDKLSIALRLCFVERVKRTIIDA